MISQHQINSPDFFSSLLRRLLRVSNNDVVGESTEGTLINSTCSINENWKSFINASPTITHIYTRRTEALIFFLRRDLHLPINPSPVAPREISRRNLIGIQSFSYDFFPSVAARFHKIQTHVDFLSFDTHWICVLLDICWLYIDRASQKLAIHWHFSVVLPWLLFYASNSGSLMELFHFVSGKYRQLIGSARTRNKE